MKIIDWKRTDTQLAPVLGISREAVRLRRKKEGLPPSKGHLGPRKTTAKVLAYARANPEEPVASIAKRFKRDYYATYALLRRFTLLTRRLQHKDFTAQTFNWNLPNKVLSQIWEIPPINVGIRRYQLKKGPATLKEGEANYHQAVKKEYAKAAHSQKLAA